MSDKSLQIFGKEYTVPSIRSNKAKRSQVKSKRQERRAAIKNNDGSRTNKEIRQKFNSEIRNLRGGKTWAGEVISDSREFIDDVKELKSDVEKSFVGRTFSQAKDIVGAVASSDPEKIIKQGVDTFNFAKDTFSKRKNNDIVTNNMPQDGCNCS
jgi:hypothetical protein